jgi:hypothetical protein
MGQDQRRFDRILQPFEVKCRRANEPLKPWITTLTRDLSAAGMCVQGSERFEVGALLDVHIELPGVPGVLHLQGRVVWQKGTAVEYGVEFIQITPDQQAQIDELVQFLKKRHKPPDP